MPYCLIAENTAAGAEQFERILAHVRGTGPLPPDGARLVLAGSADPGWRVISVWDSQEAQKRFFAERLAPACAQAGVSYDSINKTLFEVHTLAAGDLTGALQPA
jgi:hypothetical protein